MISLLFPIITELSVNEKGFILLSSGLSTVLNMWLDFEPTNRQNEPTVDVQSPNGARQLSMRRNHFLFVNSSPLLGLPFLYKKIVTTFVSKCQW